MAHPERVKAFERLRVKYNPLMTALLWKLTGDREIFAEAMQYALLGMWQHLEKLNGKRASGYLYRIVLSANTRAWRNRIGKDGHINSDLVAGQFAEDCNPADSELIEGVRRAIAQLPRKQAGAIAMRYLEQKSYDVIAKELLCSSAAARSHVSKALAVLKRKLDNE
jgi:RNA polymerase sigma-70 factor (ECF subfamily)